MRWAHARGALAETDHRATLLVLPDDVQRDLDLPEALSVTADPDVAREDGATLVIAGHALVAVVADRTLQSGDVGRTYLPWPDSQPPRPETLLARARERFDVDHGRIEAAGHPARAYLPVLRLGTLVTYSVSLDDRFHEREEVWLDARTGLVLPDDLRNTIERQDTSPSVGQRLPILTPDFALAAREADTAIRAKGARRLERLARDSREARELELSRAAAYYDAVDESIERRRATAAPDRAAVLDAQAGATRAERARRLAEIEDTFRPALDVRPFRAHLLAVPALQVPLRIRRGDRGYPFSLVWLLGASAFVPVRCPSCGAAQTLVAGRSSLGCRSCLGPPGPPTPNGDQPVPPAQDAGPPVPPAPNGDRPAPPDHRPKPASAPRPTHAPASQKAAALAALHEKVRAARARQERVLREGPKLATRVLEAAVTEGRWPNRALERHSPAKVLLHLYGPAAPVIALGMLPEDVPLSMRLATASPDDSELESTTGAVDAGLVEYTFTFRWRLESGQAVLAEVLPFEKVLDARLPPIATLRGRAARLSTGTPFPRVALDDVGSVLWTHAVPIVGLPLVARCIACWWRVRSELRDPGSAAITAAALLDAVGTTAKLRPAVEVSRRLADAGEADELAAEIRRTISAERGW